MTTLEDSPLYQAESLVVAVMFSTTLPLAGKSLSHNHCLGDAEATIVLQEPNI